MAGEWHETFFDKAANDHWEAAVSAAHTADEVEFLLTALEASAQSNLLDVAAGRGRLSIPMAERCHRVIAVDYSWDGVSTLKARIASHPNVLIVRADMRAVPLASSLDGSYCMGNSFGYFDISGVVRFLREVTRLLRPGARFVFESATVAESLLPNLSENTTHEFGGVTVRGHHTYLPERSCLSSVLRFSDGTTRLVEQLVLPLERIKHILDSNGFEVEHLLGGIDWRPYTADEDRLLVISRLRQRRAL